jgi:hypothetical protein
MHGNSMAFHPSQSLIRRCNCCMAKMLLLCMQKKGHGAYVISYVIRNSMEFYYHKDLVSKAPLHGKIFIDVKN